MQSFKLLISDQINIFFKKYNLSITPEFQSSPPGVMADISCNSLLKASRAIGKKPYDVAQEVAVDIKNLDFVQDCYVAQPGYLNIVLRDNAIERAIEQQLHSPLNGILPLSIGKTLIDFGGPNIKPMHVGHMRSFFLGESLSRMLRITGNDVITDIHLGDWGLPCGIILGQLFLLYPELHSCTCKLPFDYAELALVYPEGAKKCKEEPLRMQEARTLTAKLQEGDVHLNNLWNQIVELSLGHIKSICARLGVHFDLWKGEKDVQSSIPELIEFFKAKGITSFLDNALCIEGGKSGDSKDVPTLVLQRADGSSLYATTDLATVKDRTTLNLENIWYVVDNRQSLHFAQVFRACQISDLGKGIEFEHIGFGTINGPDAKPYRTRAGGVQTLESLLDQAQMRALERLNQGQEKISDPLTCAEKIGMSALKIADLSNFRSSDYQLDVDQALSFEGYTGPYLLYSMVRINKILKGMSSLFGNIKISTAEERELIILLLGLGESVHTSIHSRSPHHIVKWAFSTAHAFGKFYHQCPVLAAHDSDIKLSRLKICKATANAMGTALYLLGCEVPEAM